METVLLYILGVVIIVVGVALSIGLHEIGHLIPAKRFGVKVGQWMIGFGPTLWKRKFGETEYGVKAIPLGGYISMAGMFPPGKVKTGAVSLAENIYLLKIKRPWAPKGDVNHSTGPNPPELSPDQIQAKYDKDPVLWDASENLDVACEQCHSSYWYPKEDAAFYRGLDSRLKALAPPSRGKSISR